MDFQQTPTENGWRVTLNKRIEVEFDRIENVQKFYGLWRAAGDTEDPERLAELIAQAQDNDLGIAG